MAGRKHGGSHTANGASLLFKQTSRLHGVYFRSTGSVSIEASQLVWHLQAGSVTVQHAPQLHHKLQRSQDRQGLASKL